MEISIKILPYSFYVLEPETNQITVVAFQPVQLAQASFLQKNLRSVHMFPKIIFSIHLFEQAKGQLISECPFDV